MRPYTVRGSWQQAAVFLLLLALLPLLAWGAAASDFAPWLNLAVLIPALGLVLTGPTGSGVLAAACACLFLFAGLRAGAPAAAIGFQLIGLTLAAAPAWLHHQKESELDRGHQEYLLTLEERLSLAREQYKTDLIVHVSNQRKIQKYFLLNRVSRLFGSQLELAKLAEVIIQEVRDIIGAERGRYMLALQFAASDTPLLATLPAGIEAAAVVDDQFGLWVAQHRTALQVADTQKDFRFRGPDGEDAPRSLMLAPLLSDGRVIGVLRAESAYTHIFTTDDLRLFTILADLGAVAAENARLYQRTQELAITDGLTGLYLRRFFSDRLDEELTRFREHGTAFSLLIVDLDHFKQVNDRLGHLAGDQVLTQIAETLRQDARNTDIICRFGGEEFALLLPHTPCRAGLSLAERIRRHVAERKFSAGREQVSLTVSIGAAGCPDHADSATSLFKAADEALYAAKRQGRNRVVLSGEGGA